MQSREEFEEELNVEVVECLEGGINWASST